MDTKRKKFNRKPPRGNKKLILSMVAIVMLSFSVGYMTRYVLSTSTIILIENQTSSITSIPVDYSNHAEAVILAIRGDNNMGTTGHVIVQIQPGQNRVLINTNPFVETDTQLSVDTAVAVAAEFTNRTLSNSDIVITFDANATLVGGPSAGGATTIAAIAAMSGRNVRQDTTITGTINDDGTIGQVGGVLEKAQAAAEVGIKTILIPKGQSTVVLYQQENINGRTVYIPKESNLIDIARDQWNVTVIEVSNINEAAGYLIN